MSYDIKVAIKKVSAKPSSFALVEGKKSHMMVFASTSPIVTEVQNTCGQGKVIAKGLCFLEGKIIVFKTKAPPQTGWNAHLKKVFVDTKCPPSPFEFRQLGEGESDEVESHEGNGEDHSPQGTPQTTTSSTTPPVIGRERSGGMSKTPPPTPPTTNRPPLGGNAPKPQGWTSAKPSAETKPTGVTIGTKAPPTPPPQTPKPGTWQSATPTALQQAKAEFDKRFKGIISLYQKKLSDPKLEQEKELLFKEAGTKAGVKDWDGAYDALDALEILIGSSHETETEDEGDDSLGEGVEDLHRRAALQAPTLARNTAVARETSTRLIKPDGSFDGDFDTLLNEVGTQPKSPQKKHLTRMLKQLKDDPALREKITSIPQPDPKNPANDFIRATLGLKRDEVVTAAHARQAVLSSLMAEMRQKDVGSCFGTSVAIRIHDTQPGNFLNDMVALMTTGKLTRTVDGEQIEVPISPNMSMGQVDQKMKLKRSGAKVGDKVDLHDAPGFSASLDTLGVPPEKRKEVVDEALTELRASKTAKIKAALAALPKTVDKKVRKKLEQDALIALRDAPDSDVKALIVEVTKNLDPTQKAAAATACDNYDTAAEDEVTPNDILRQVAMKRAGITEADLLALERMRDLGKKVRALQGESTTPEAQKVMNAYSKVADLVTSKREKFETYEKELNASQNGFLAQQDNRLLRAWEYTVSAMAEKGTTKRQTTRLTKAATKTVNDQMDTILTEAKLTADPGLKVKLDDAAKKLKTKFEALFKARIQSGYDASVQGELSADGSSDRGAFALFDTTGATDPADWIKIDDERAYADVVSGLMMESWLELYGKEKDVELRNQARALADKLAEAARTEGFIKSANDNTKAQYDGEEQKPWQAVRGNLSKNLLPVYYEKPAPKMVKRKPTSTADLMNFILESTKAMWTDIQDGVNRDPEGASIPVSSGTHAFTLRPGSPGLKAAIESGEDPATWTSKKVNADKAKARGQRETKLTPGLKKSILDNVLAGYRKAKSLRKLIETALGPDPTVDDLRKAIADSCGDDKLKKRMQNKMAFAMTQVVLPPVQAADLDKVIDKSLEKLGVPEGKREAVKNKAHTTALAGSATEASMTTIEKAIAAALKAEAVEDDEAAAGLKVNGALQSAIEPPGIVFADTNWGGGDHHTVFAMVTNPLTDELEMWRMNEDGSDPSIPDQAKWTGKEWSMPNNPTSFGGI